MHIENPAFQRAPLYFFATMGAIQLETAKSNRKAKSKTHKTLNCNELRSNNKLLERTKHMYSSLSGLGQKKTNQTNVDKPKSSHMNYNKEKTKQGHCLL